MSESIFSVRVIGEWNSLPDSIIHFNTVNTFKAKIDVFIEESGIYLSLIHI